MRALPAGWPDPADPVQTPPTVYLRLPGSAWPPASVQGDEELPAGTTRVGSWSIDCDLDAPLMPGQVNATTKFTIATASCTIPQPDGGLLAPWSPGSLAPPKSGRCELIASYDGPAGATAFVLGKFVLDPIKGKLSEKFLSLTMVQDMVRLRKRHQMPTGATNGAQLLNGAAARNGYSIAYTEGTIGMFGSYFPQRVDELSAMQETARANLSAIYLSMDGGTIKVLGPTYLLATGAAVETLNVLDSLEDLSWSQDPGGIADRVEVAYIPPRYASAGIGVAPFNRASVWTAPKDQGIPAGATIAFDFDPGSYIEPVATGGSFQIMANQNRSGSGGAYVLTGSILQRSSGNFGIWIHNHLGFGVYLVLPWDRGVYSEDGEIVAGIDRGWDVPKGTPSFIPGVIDTASDSEPTVAAWGVGAEDATNTLRFDFGRNVQTAGDAATRLTHIVGRVTQASYLIEDVNVVPHLGRELGDVSRVLMAENGLDRKCLTTGIKVSGDNTGVRQSLTLALPS